MGANWLRWRTRMPARGRGSLARAKRRHENQKRSRCGRTGPISPVKTSTTEAFATGAWLCWCKRRALGRPKFGAAPRAFAPPAARPLGVWRCAERPTEVSSPDCCCRLQLFSLGKARISTAAERRRGYLNALASAALNTSLTGPASHHTFPTLMQPKCRARRWA